MWCASCSVSAAGSTANCPTSTVLPDPPDPTRPADWDTRPSRVSTRSDWNHWDLCRYSHCYIPTGYVIYRIRVRRGGRKRPVPKGATYGKPVHHGVNQMKFARSLQSVAEVGLSIPDWWCGWRCCLIDSPERTTHYLVLLGNLVTYLPQWLKLSSCGCCWSLIRVTTRFLFWSASVLFWHVNKLVRLYLEHCRTASLSLLSSSSRDGIDFSSFRFEELCISRFNTCDLPIFLSGWKTTVFYAVPPSGVWICRDVSIRSPANLFSHYGGVFFWKKVTQRPGEIRLFQPRLHLKPARRLTWIVTAGPHRLRCGLQFPDAAHPSYVFF